MTFHEDFRRDFLQRHRTVQRQSAPLEAAKTTRNADEAVTPPRSVS